MTVSVPVAADVSAPVSVAKAAAPASAPDSARGASFESEMEDAIGTEPPAASFPAHIARAGGAQPPAASLPSAIEHAGGGLPAGASLESEIARAIGASPRAAGNGGTPLPAPPPPADPSASSPAGTLPPVSRGGSERERREPPAPRHQVHAGADPRATAAAIPPNLAPPDPVLLHLLRLGMSANGASMPVAPAGEPAQQQTPPPGAQPVPVAAAPPAAGELAFGLRLKMEPAAPAGGAPVQAAHPRSNVPAPAEKATAPREHEPAEAAPQDKILSQGDHSEKGLQPHPQTGETAVAAAPPAAHAAAAAPSAAAVYQSPAAGTHAAGTAEVSARDRLAAAEAVAAAPPPAAPRPVNDLSLRISSAGDNVSVRVSERAGQVQVVVRSSDSAVGHGLRADLPDLVHRLGAHGTVSEVWRSAESTQSNTDTHQQHQPPQQQGRGRQGENQNPQQRARNFQSELAESARFARRHA